MIARSLVALTALGLATLVIAGPPGPIDGVDIPTDFGSGNLVATQRNYTQFGDYTVTKASRGGGSELNALYVTSDALNLYLGITGNLEENANRLNIWFDSVAGGVHILTADGLPPVPWADPAIPEEEPPGDGMEGDALPPLESDTTTDALFDYVVSINVTGTPPSSDVWTDMWDLNTQTSTFKGRATMESGNGDLDDSGSNQWGMQVALNNLNTAGVIGCGFFEDPCWFDSSATVETAAATATSGFEISVPLADLGINPCAGAATIHIWAHVTGSTGFRSNQSLPSMRPALGEQVQNAGQAETDWYDPTFPLPESAYAAVAVTHTTTVGAVVNDCDSSGTEDVCDILNGLVNDVNMNGIPDVEVCEKFCGDGIIQTPNGDGFNEVCDDGSKTSCESATCDCDCTPAACGDGTLNVTAGEQCDDGGTASGDGCDATCQDEFCGDNIVNDSPNEECDDGATVGGDGCDENCINEICGNGVVQTAAGEACDDGNTANGDGCSLICTVETGWECVDNVSVCTEICGDGQTVGAEECDDTNTVNGDGCDNNCTVTACGNGIVTAGEECDDGNTVSGDRCDASCVLPPESLPPLVNGTIKGDEAAYGAAESVQAVMTQFGDDQSELNAAYCVVSGRLYLLLTGNLQNNFNKLEILIDSKAGGENAYSGIPGQDGTNIMGPAGGGGLVFDAGFEADYHVFVRRGAATFDIDIAELGTANYSFHQNVFGGSDAGISTTGVATATGGFGGNVSPIDVAYDNSNILGVAFGCDAADQVAAAAVQTGLELSIALKDLGYTGGDIKILAFVNGQQHDFASNQFLGPLTPPQCNLGGDGAGAFTGTVAFDLNTFAGSQFFTCSPVVCGNGVVEVGEECDDTNAINGDGCDNNCTITGCGNGVVTSGETCDDGFTDACGSCNADCTAAGVVSTCGDADLCPETEQCDDGNTNDADGCRNNCLYECKDVNDCGKCETCDPVTHTCVKNLPNCCTTDTQCGKCETCDLINNTCNKDVPNCCTEDSQCPGKCDVCNLTNNLCEKAPDCCTMDAQCGKCETCDLVTNLCNKDVPNCCTSDAQCGKCETCDLVNNTCNKDVPNCCTSDAQCGKCETCDVTDNTCNKDVPNCCTSDAQCGKCETCDLANNTCNKDVPDCCTMDAQCPGKCQVCDLANNTCVKAAGCCTMDAQCGKCETCNLANNTCVKNVPNCCTMDAQCGAGEFCNLADNTCQVACLPPVVIGDISSRYIEIRPDASVTDPVAFHVVCGDDGGNPNEGWVQLTHVDYPEDPAGTVLINIGKTTALCADADFLTADAWTSGGNNALYVTGLPVCSSFATLANGGPISRPTVTARCVDCAAPDAAPVQPADPTWVFCDSSGDGQTTFFSDLFKQFSNTAAAGGPDGTGPDPIIEVDTQGNWKDVPDQQVTFFADIFQCFGVTAAGGGQTWMGPTCP
ncbi:MAG: DUF4215 domain-containing protein [Phycisphaerae bacterium]